MTNIGVTHQSDNIGVTHQSDRSVLSVGQADYRTIFYPGVLGSWMPTNCAGLRVTCITKIKCMYTITISYASLHVLGKKETPTHTTGY